MSAKDLTAVPSLILKKVYWLLRGQDLPAGLADPADLSPWLAVLEKQFPPPTPLDEDDRDGGFK